jgi:hypothetical protein
LQREILDGSYARDAERLMEYTAKSGEIQEELRWEIQWRYDEVQGRYREAWREHMEIPRRSGENPGKSGRGTRRSGRDPVNL